jgi:hypothetical protein
MTEDIFYQDEGQFKITAASVGVSKLRWKSIKHNEIISNLHIELMEKNRFDHLPVEEVDGSVIKFFKTAVPNKYDKIDELKININDIIALDTNIRDVIEKFATQNRTFFFLRYQKTISGLITLGNLNCKQVQIYIFSLVCELERELGDFLNHFLSEKDITEWLNRKIKANIQNEKYKNILLSYANLIDSDLENNLTEHLFLVDLFKIINDTNLYLQLDYSKLEWEKMKSVNELRNRIAHPTRSLIDADNTIFKLHERISKIEDLTFRLSTIKKDRKFH